MKVDGRHKQNVKYNAGFRELNSRSTATKEVDEENNLAAAGREECRQQITRSTSMKDVDKAGRRYELALMRGANKSSTRTTVVAR